MREKKRSPSENSEYFEPVFRHASNGLWLIALVPCALLCGATNTVKISSTYLTIATISAGLLVSSLCTVFKGLEQLCVNLTNCVIASLVNAVLLTSIQNLGITYSFCVAIISVTSYCYVLKTIVYSCPKSFTFGEATIVAQSLILYVASFILNTQSSFSERPKSCDGVATFILQAGFFTVFIPLTLAYYHRQRMQQLWIFITAVVSSFLVFAVCLPYLVLRINSLLWILELLNDPISIGLVVCWTMCCVFCIYCLWKQTASNMPASSASRKSFHFAILFVLMPGLILKPCLMYLVSGIGFAILVGIEIIRKLRISEFSRMLQSCFDVFKDEKDEGSLALTPLYLMLGCVSPFWIYPVSFRNSIPLPILAGVLSIAVGDTAASICGTCFGKFHWLGTRKTIEGTIGCILSQILVLSVFGAIGIIQTLDTLAIYKSLLVIITTSLVEAITDQIDNVVLPLVSYILFMLLFY